MSSQALWIIANPKSTEKELLAAISSLPKCPDEPPSFWTKIANDRAFKPFHRCQVICQLFKRHVRAGMKIRDLARVLHYPHWLKPKDIKLVGLVGGVIPVEASFDDSIFVIYCLPDLVHSYAIYLSVQKQVEEVDFVNLLLSKKRTIPGNNAILEIYVGDGNEPDN